VGQISAFTVEGRVGAGVPIRDFSDPTAPWTGPAGEDVSLGIGFSFAPRWWIAPYGGFSQHRFACGARGCGTETDLITSGFDAGLRFRLLPGTPAPWIRIGMISYRVEASVPVEGGAREIVSDRAQGLEAGVGLLFQLRPGLLLAPGVRFARLNPFFEGPGSLPMRYLVADIGLILGF